MRKTKSIRNFTYINEGRRLMKKTELSITKLEVIS